MPVSGHLEITKKTKEEKKWSVLYHHHQEVIAVYTVLIYYSERFLFFSGFVLQNIGHSSRAHFVIQVFFFVGNTGNICVHGCVVFCRINMPYFM